MKRLGIGLTVTALIAVPACGGSSGSDDDDDAGDGGTSSGTGGRGGKGGSTSNAGEDGEETGATGGSGGNGGKGGSSGGKGGSSGGKGGSSGKGGASSGGTGGASGSIGLGGFAGTQEPGSVPEQLVGVWQETRASAGSYENAFGESFDITSGFSVQLKLAADGSYYFAHYASGVSPSCENVSYFDQSVGTAVIGDDTLTLYPAERRLDVDDCALPTSEELANDPIEFSLSIMDAFHFYGGLRTYEMHLEGGPQPLDLELLLRTPLADPPVPAEPDDFVLGTVGPFEELQGLWAPSEGTDTGFFDAATGDAYLPELNGSPHQWLRFEGDAYETAVALQTINVEGVCKADVIYYEQGLGLFQVNEDIGGRGVHFEGDTRLEATAARLIVNVRECDADDGVYQFDVPPQISYWTFIYFTRDMPPESLQLRCDYPFSEFQSLLCTSALTMYRRE